jgi:hypothetical protein
VAWDGPLVLGLELGVRVEVVEERSDEVGKGVRGEGTEGFVEGVGNEVAGEPEGRSRDRERKPELDDIPQLLEWEPVEQECNHDARER